jgi:hypothetical protein
MESDQQTPASGQQSKRPKPRGTPWPPGVSGNPTGSHIGKRTMVLFDAMVGEFGGADLSATDRALLLQACRLLARKFRDDLAAVAASNTARHILNGLRERHRHDAGAASSEWSPLKASLAAKVTSEPING